MITDLIRQKRFDLVTSQRTTSSLHHQTKASQPQLDNIPNQHDHRTATITTTTLIPNPPSLSYLQIGLTYAEYGARPSCAAPEGIYPTEPLQAPPPWAILTPRVGRQSCSECWRWLEFFRRKNREVGERGGLVCYLKISIEPDSDKYQIHAGCERFPASETKQGGRSSF